MMSILCVICLSVLFVQCGGGDDEPTLSCEDCELLSVVTTYCDNGDGTVSVTLAGETTTLNLEGISFEDFIANLEMVGVECTAQ